MTNSFFIYVLQTNSLIICRKWGKNVRIPDGKHGKCVYMMTLLSTDLTQSHAEKLLTVDFTNPGVRC